MQSYKLYQPKTLTPERSYRVDCRKTLNRTITKRDYPTPVGTKVYWSERAGRIGSKAKAFRCGIIQKHFVNANGIPAYEVKVLWATVRNSKGKVRVKQDFGIRRPLVSVVENGKIDSEEKVNLNLIREFGHSLQDFLAVPNALLPINK